MSAHCYLRNLIDQYLSKNLSLPYARIYSFFSRLKLSIYPSISSPCGATILCPTLSTPIFCSVFFFILVGFTRITIFGFLIHVLMWVLFPLYLRWLFVRQLSPFFLISHIFLGYHGNPTNTNTKHGKNSRYTMDLVCKEHPTNIQIPHNIMLRLNNNNINDTLKKFQVIYTIQILITKMLGGIMKKMFFFSMGRCWYQLRIWRYSKGHS